MRWTFPPGEPHSVTFLGPQSSLPPAFDPAAPKPAGGPSYDASAYTSSGYLLLGKTYALTFPKPGRTSIIAFFTGNMAACKAWS